jgi:hypothetical protein
MNNDNYKNLSEAQLKKIKKDIEDILADRENRMTKAVKELNLPALKSIIAENIDHDLPQSTWEALSFYKMEVKDIPFFEYVRTFTSYQKNDDNCTNGRNITKTAIWRGLYNKELFNYFINQPNFLPLIQEQIEESYLFSQREIPKKVIHELFDRNLIIPTKDLFNKALKDKCLNYLEYFIKNDLISISEDTYLEIYFNNWTEMDKDSFKLMDEKYPKYKDIALSELMHKSYNGNNYHYNFPPQLWDKYKHFIKSDDELFNKIIATHKINNYDIHPIVSSFSEASPAQDKKFYKFVFLIAEKYPQYMKEIKRYESPFTQPFREIFRKVIEQVELKMDLDNELIENSSSINKKLKL